MLSPRLAQLEKLLIADPADPFVLYGLAQEHTKLGDHERAAGFYDRCTAADPGYCYAYYHKALSQQALGLMEPMRETLKAGIAAARAAGDGKALGELGSLLESVE